MAQNTCQNLSMFMSVGLVRISSQKISKISLFRSFLKLKSNFESQIFAIFDNSYTRPKIFIIIIVVIGFELKVGVLNLVFFCSRSRHKTFLQCFA